MDGSREIQSTPGLVAGPKPVASIHGGKLTALDRFGTPVWIAVGISIIGLAVFAVLG